MDKIDGIYVIDKDVALPHGGVVPFLLSEV